MKNRKNTYENGIMNAIWDNAAAELLEAEQRLAGKKKFSLCKTLGFIALTLAFCILFTEIFFGSAVGAKQVATRTTLKMGGGFSEVKLEYTDPEGNPLEKPKLQNKKYYATYVPKDFILTEVTTNKLHSSTSYVWKKEEDLLVLSIYSLESTLKVGVTYKDEVSECDINGYKGVLAKCADGIVVIWANESAKFMISGRISEQDAFKMANSLQKGV